MRKNTEYEQYVKMGRDLVGQIECYQAQIAFYATKVCEIKHGGRTRSTVYTLSKYATDIGINRKTLSEWVAVYRNVIQKLGKEAKEVTSKDWSVANRVQNLLKDEKRTVQTIMGVKGAKTHGYKQEVSAERIKDLFKQNYDGPSFQKELYAWNDYIVFIKNKLVGRDLSQVSTSSLLSLKENLDAASDTILRHLTNTPGSKKSSVKTRKASVTA